MPSPARRVRSAVNNRRRDLRRMVAKRIITQEEAKYILGSYQIYKFLKSVEPVTKTGVFTGKNYE
jgi:hypothetical protein